jgi:dTDP-4-dehydrorhamnose reductase
MKVFVLGHKGMLGHVVTAFLREKGLDVLTSGARYTALPNDPLISEARASSADWVINAIGKIKQKTTEPSELIAANALLPIQLKTYLHPHQRIIHASTDCVFSGTRGNYAVTDERDATDVYGFSKAMGEVAAEPGRCQILRVSIIGPELKSGAGLMGWFLSQTSGIKGYTNHYWNGITTLEWAKLAVGIMQGSLVLDSPIVQIVSAAPVSKYELLKQISQVWRHDIAIDPMEAPENIDRTLAPGLVRSPILSQLQEQYDWYQKMRRANS